MGFDPVVANAGRLRILTALAVEHRQEFVRLRRSTALTDGNLASHARRLEAAGLIEIDKQFRAGKPVTHLTLTSEGRKALEAHVRRLMSALSHRRLPDAEEDAVEIGPVEVRSAITPEPQTVAADDWID